MSETVETRLKVLETTVTDLKVSQAANFKKMFRVLEGNGNVPGIKTCVKLQEASLKRLYKWVAGLTMVAVGTIGEIIRRHI